MAHSGKKAKKVFYFPHEQFWHLNSEANTARLCNSCIINEIVLLVYRQKGGGTEEHLKKQKMRSNRQFRNPYQSRIE